MNAFVTEMDDLVEDVEATAKLQAEKNQLSVWLDENRNTDDNKLYSKNVRRYNKLLRNGTVYVDSLAARRSQIKNAKDLAKFLTELK